MSDPADLPHPAIVVMAYDRPRSLARLLGSLDAADCPAGTELILSIDGGGPAAVAGLAHAFAWRHGRKSVRVMDRRLGLVGHSLACGDLAAEFEAVIMLEDDLFVSRHFYGFAAAALARYAAEPRLAGLALYSQRFNETVRRPFTPIDDGADVFFVQLMPWGHVWTADQWRRFRAWLASSEANARIAPGVPIDVRRWPETSWKKLFVSYMVDCGLYCACPRLGHATNFSDAGVHTRRNTSFLQVELAAAPRSLVLPSLAESRAVYDAWCEIVPPLLAPALEPLVGDAEVSIDLHGAKDPAEQRAAYMLTTQRCREAVARFGLRLRPREANVLHGIKGGEIALAPTEAVVARRRAGALPFHEYAYGYDQLSAADLAASLAAKLARRIGEELRRAAPG